MPNHGQIYHGSLWSNQLDDLYPRPDCTNPHCAFYPSHDTPHIHLTDHPFRPTPDFAQIYFFHCPGFRCPYVNNSGHKPCISFPLIRYDAPPAVRIGDNSLNLAQVHLTLGSCRLLHTSSCTIVCRPNCSRTWEHIPGTSHWAHVHNLISSTVFVYNKSSLLKNHIILVFWEIVLKTNIKMFFPSEHN